MVRRFASAGFTLIEFLMVLVVIAIVAGIAFFALNSYSNNQPLLNASKELLTNLRAVQNQVINGVGGISVRSAIIPGNCSPSASCAYTLIQSPTSLVTMDLPKGVGVSLTSGLDTAICFVHPNLAAFDASNRCISAANPETSCSGGSSSFLCRNGTLLAETQIIVTLSNGVVQKQVVIEGLGMRITRIYEQ